MNRTFAEYMQDLQRSIWQTQAFLLYNTELEITLQIRRNFGYILNKSFVYLQGVLESGGLCYTVVKRFSFIAEKEKLRLNLNNYLYEKRSLRISFVYLRILYERTAGVLSRSFKLRSDIHVKLIVQIYASKLNSTDWPR